MLPAAKQIFFKQLKRRRKWFGSKALVVIGLCLSGAASTFAQISNPLGKVVLVRNVRVADCQSKQLIEVVVLVSDGKMKRINSANEVPSDAVVLDGGGRILTLGAGGKIILQSDKGNPFFTYQMKPSFMKVAIILAANELYESLLEFDLSDRSRFDCLPDGLGNGDFDNGSYFRAPRFRKNISGSFLKKSLPACGVMTPKRADIECFLSAI